MLIIFTWKKIHVAQYTNIYRGWKFKKKGKVYNKNLESGLTLDKIKELYKAVENFRLT